MRLALVAMLSSISLTVSAQDSSIVFIAAGQSLGEVVTPQKKYRYPDFKQGEIRFKDGSLSRAKLNYDFLNGEVEFISAKNDTLAIVKEQMLNIKQVTIDSSNFYFANGYLEEVASTTIGKLLKRQQYKILKREKIGGYGQPSSTAAIDSYSSFSIDGQFQPNLKVMQDVTLIKANEYYFADRFLSVQRANKRNLTKIFSKKKTEIENYLKNNQVDFTSEQDLVKLLTYLGSSSTD